MSNRIFETDEYVVEELEHCYNIMQFKSKLCMDVIVIPKQIMKDIAEKVLIDELTEAGKEIIQRGKMITQRKIIQLGEEVKKYRKRRIIMMVFIFCILLFILIKETYTQ